MIFKKWLKENRFLFVIIVIDILFVIFLCFVQANQSWVETYYSKIIYPQITRFFSLISDRFFFSISELAILILCGYFIVKFIKSIISIIKKKQTCIQIARTCLKWGFIICSLIIIQFYLAWGINFFRIPLKQRIPFEQKKISNKQLLFVIEHLIKSSNQLYTNNSPNSNEINQYINDGIGKVILKLDNTNVYNYTAQQGKTLFLNILLKKMLVSGITSPFFHEAHYRSDLFPAEIPLTLAHEKAHLNGYTSESEANFIGYLACLHSKNRFCQFSGNIMILPYFLSQLEQKEQKKYYQQLRKEILDIYRKIRQRTRNDIGWLSHLQAKVNDAYLKMNKVKKGVRDYGAVVELLLGYKELY